MEAPRLEPELEDGQTTMHSVSVRSCYHSAVSACPERGQWARGRTNVCVPFWASRRVQGDESLTPHPITLDLREPAQTSIPPPHPPPPLLMSPPAEALSPSPSMPLFPPSCPSSGPPVDPMSLQRGEVVQNATASSAAKLAGQMSADAQLGDCLVNGDSSDHGRASGSANPGVFNRPKTREMQALQDSEQWAKLPLREQAEAGQKVKAAFLMFANDRINNEHIWIYWLDQAGKSGLDFSMYIHAYGVAPRGNSTWRRRGSPSLARYLVHQQVRTTWCQMWEAQMLLLEKALADSANTHFLMVSSDSVPVKPLSFIYSELSSKPLSRFCSDDYWRKPWPRAETWSVLWRGDAALFVENKEFSRKHFRRDCEEETAWYFPLLARWGEHGGKAAVDRECIMFSNWKDGEKACKEEWAVNADRCNCPKLRSGEKTPANFKHPVIYRRVPAAGFEELVRSPFWFARKITDGALTEELKDMLHENFTKESLVQPPKRSRRHFFR
ncbi:unnamed protein product [Prorocentrum cordatum]|uniref:Protein xylosyltransferase n=1 Tax=Prorocentrum cordatum TaxID=2364126 RepID=A0ABN9WR93_9DINO|nr:unnamed protein product [Polarella glacialis]